MEAREAQQHAVHVSWTDLSSQFREKVSYKQLTTRIAFVGHKARPGIPMFGVLVKVLARKDMSLITAFDILFKSDLRKQYPRISALRTNSKLLSAFKN